MSEKKEKAPAPAPAADKATAPKKKLPIMLIGIVGAIMVVEAVVVFLFFSMIGPKHADAAPPEHGVVHDDTKGVVEVLIVEDKFQNLQQGKVWYWDIGVYVQVQKKNAEQIKSILESRGNEIKEEIGRIIGKAQPAQLREPDGQTLNRQLTALLTKVLGNDPDDKPIVEKVIVPRLRGMRGEY